MGRAAELALFAAACLQSSWMGSRLLPCCLRDPVTRSWSVCCSRLCTVELLFSFMVCLAESNACGVSKTDWHCSRAFLNSDQTYGTILSATLG